MPSLYCALLTLAAGSSRFRPLTLHVVGRSSTLELVHGVWACLAVAHASACAVGVAEASDVHSFAVVHFLHDLADGARRPEIAADPVAAAASTGDAVSVLDLFTVAAQAAHDAVDHTTAAAVLAEGHTHSPPVHARRAAQAAQAAVAAVGTAATTVAETVESAKVPADFSARAAGSHARGAVHPRPLGASSLNDDGCGGHVGRLFDCKQRRSQEQLVLQLAE
eukprot:INCI12938.1.p1 GENE.INCI12938.1~~INCI12938.1.p1  ORF type:complete len:222 (+),score=37.56 INCI12938.1:848-1513(+)